MPDTIQIMAELVSAFVSNNATPAAELPDLMKAVHAALNGTAKAASEEIKLKVVPAVPVKKSVQHDHLVSLETGQHLKSLKRHLSALGMSPDDYRAKWGLPAAYPMTCAAYSSARSEMSKALGLGKKKTTEPVETPAAVKKARAKPKAPVEAETPPAATESFQEPAEAQQDAA